MSRKNKILRAFLYQNPNPTIEQAWDAAWKHAQKTFHARSMRDMEKQIADLQAECEQLRKNAERYRWLRDRIGGHEQIEDEFVGHPGYSLSDLMAPEIDAAIDAAMEKENKQ